MKNYRIEAGILAVGLAILGVFTYFGLDAFATRERVVSVRGLAEREVKADHVIWPIVYKTTGNDLQSLYAEMKTKNGIIRDFLTKNGIAASEISIGAPTIIDLYTNQYQQRKDISDRYNITVIMTVASGKVEKVNELIPRMSELLPQGIAIVANDYSNQVQYEFKSLNTIKPQMIEEATKNAREAAKKFAEDSDSKLGKIKDATQGLFSIEDRDQYTPSIKQIRVVTSVDYYLDE